MRLIFILKSAYICTSSAIRGGPYKSEVTIPTAGKATTTTEEATLEGVFATTAPELIIA